MAKRKSPAFSFYPADWLSSPKVTAMTCEEEGAYIRLLCYAWGDPECALPDDDEMLAALSRLGERWNTCSTKIKKCFTTNEKKPGKLFNVRLLLERKRQKENSRKRSEAGLKSGAARRKKANKCSTPVEQNANKDGTKTNLSSSSSDSSSSLNTKGVNPLKPPGVEVVDLTIPEPLDTPEVREALGDWIRYKRQRGQPYKSPKFLSDFLGGFIPDGPSGLVDAIRWSLGQNYQGIFRSSEKANARQPSRTGPGQRFSPEAGLGSV